MGLDPLIQNSSQYFSRLKRGFLGKSRWPIQSHKQSMNNVCRGISGKEWVASMNNVCIVTIKRYNFE